MGFMVRMVKVRPRMVRGIPSLLRRGRDSRGGRSAGFSTNGFNGSARSTGAGGEYREVSLDEIPSNALKMFVRVYGGRVWWDGVEGHPIIYKHGGTGAAFSIPYNASSSDLARIERLIRVTADERKRERKVNENKLSYEVWKGRICNGGDRPRYVRFTYWVVVNGVPQKRVDYPAFLQPGACYETSYHVMLRGGKRVTPLPKLELVDATD